MMLYSIHNVVNLGTGIAPDYAVADLYYSDNTVYKTVVVDGSGKMEELGIASPTKYICAYELVR
jgi:nucleoside phosphorylase